VTEKPLLAVDVDGVVSLFDFESPPEAADVRFELVDGVIHCISRTSGRCLRELSRHYDLVWASGWEDRTLRLGAILDLPDYPYLSFDRSARFGTADWKLAPLQEYARERALAWIDDSFDERCYEWARARPEPTLLMPTESSRGILEVHVEALTVWAKQLDPEDAQTPDGDESR
jgi:hypothetical protein